MRTDTSGNSISSGSSTESREIPTDPAIVDGGEISRGEGKTSSTSRDTSTDILRDGKQQQAQSLVGTQSTSPLALHKPIIGGGKSVASATIRLHAGLNLFPESGHLGIENAAPRSWSTLSSELYDIATLIDQSGAKNLFAAVSVEHRGKVLGGLKKTISGTAFKKSPDNTLDGSSATQLRSSSATVLRHLMLSLVGDNNPTAEDLLAQASALAVTQLQNETHPALRDSMAFGLLRIENKLPPSLSDEITSAATKIASIAPPYEAWLEDGKISIDVVLGDSQADRKVALEKALKTAGIKEDSGSWFGSSYRGVIGEGENAVEVEVNLRYASGNDIFENVGNKDVDIIMYSGHSDYGRGLPRSIANASGAGANTRGDSKNNDDQHPQLLWIESCFGKDNLRDMREAFPDSQIMTTFGGSTPRGDFGPGISSILKGVAGRSDWPKIDKGLNRNTVSPADILIRRRYLDSDNDGRADILDRLYDVNLHHPARDFANAFLPRKTDHKPHRLQSIHGVTAASWLNRGVGEYNQAIHGVNRRSLVVCAGFFKGEGDSRPVRFERVKSKDLGESWKMEINSEFAHMPEQILRIATVYEFNRFAAKNEPGYILQQKPLKAQLNGLMAVAFTLGHDNQDLDELAWESLLKAYGLPTGLSLDLVQSYNARNDASDEKRQGGSVKNLEALLEYLAKEEPGILKALEKSVGAHAGG